MIRYEGRLGDKIIWLLTTFLLASFVIFDQNAWISAILLGTTLAVFVISFVQAKCVLKLTVKPFHVFVGVFVLYCFASSWWALNADAAVTKGMTVLQILLCMSVLDIHYSKADSVGRLADAVMWAGYVISLYAIWYYGIDEIRTLSDAGKRLGNDLTNVNTIAMAAALSLIIFVYNFFFISKKKIWQGVFAVPAVIIVAMSGSRKALVLMVAGIVAVVLFRYASKSFFKTLLRWCVLAVLLFFVFRFVLSLPLFEMVSARMEGFFALLTGTGKVDHSAWLRDQFVQAGFEQFRQTPFLGVGIGNAEALTVRVSGESTYLHNNFVELLACGGLFGFLCYYSMYGYLFYNLFKCRKSKDNYWCLCVILSGILLAMDYGMVSYYSKSTYFYFLLFFTEIRILQTSLNRQEGTPTNEPKQFAPKGQKIYNG